MPDLPTASLTVDDEAGAFAGGTGYLMVVACTEKNADTTPRVMASTKAILTQHGYSPAVDYCALHFEKTRKPVIFVAVPTVTVGVLGRQNSTGVTGTCAISVAAGVNGYLEETDCTVTVVSGGVIGTDQITFNFTADGGKVTKLVRLGTAASYAVPYLGIVLNFGAGTLVAGDVFKFTTTAPMWDSAGLTAARTALAAQQNLARSFLIVGDISTSGFATFITTEINAYETANQRFAYARAQVRDRLPLASMSRVKKSMTGSPTLTFVVTANTITRSAGSWITDGFAIDDQVTVAGSASNNVTGTVTAVTATVLTVSSALANEGPVSNCTVVGSSKLVFASGGKTITRFSGSWLNDGFQVGDLVTTAGTASNNFTAAITTLTATVMTFTTPTLVNETIRSDLATATKGETMSAFISNVTATFASIDAQRRIDLAVGRARKLSPITGWMFRRPVAWAASIREYEHDVQIPNWRKSDDPLDGWSMEDVATPGLIVEYDERSIGGALAARFTCLRTYGNGPNGAFIAMSVTRATEGSLLSRTHNLAVANVACTISQKATEDAIGQVLALKDDGTGTDDSLGRIEERVNSALELALLQAGAEGARASSARWKASRSDVLNVVGAQLTGTLDLRLNGTLEKITTRVRIQTAG